jgi:O-antigen/teichoic acid export membrane protein
MLKASSAVMLVVLRGELRVGETAIIHTGYVFVWISAGIILIHHDLGVYALIWGVILGNFIKSVWGYLKISTGFGVPSIEIADSLIGYAKYGVIPSVQGQVHSWIDLFIIGAVMSPSAVGAYEIAWSIANPIMIISQAIGTTIFPQISSWESNQSFRKVETLIPKIISPTLILVFPAVIGGALISNELLTLIFGEAFGIAAIPLVILLFGKIPEALKQIFGKTLYGINQPTYVNNAAIIDITSNVVLNIILIWNFGLIGAAVGTSSAMLIGTIYRGYCLNRFIKIKIDYIEIGWYIISSLAMGAVLLAIKNNFVITSRIELFTIVGICVITYHIFVIGYKPLRHRIKRIVIKQFE